ncbi:MAG: ClpXP protease specificity-enhancing factor SspB [Proteobacteria bacterium]|nr:ClpXP protease specificity-enhancing factor SspB [Pseudomonadota bacterium]
MTTEPQSEDLIRYDVMVQEALIGVVRKVLIEAGRSGLPGDHHFYITFRSRATGVKLSPRLLEKYPEEMTIVLQHQFWDLQVSESGFEVGLSFGGIAERLHVPFDALTGFYDPSVQFGLKFSPDEAQADNDSGDETEGEEAQAAPIAKIEEAAKPKSADKPRRKSKPAAEKEGAAAPPTDSDEPVQDEAPQAGAEVVSLDAFRKKK